MIYNPESLLIFETNIRDTLLLKLMSGEIWVKEAKKLMEAVV